MSYKVSFNEYSYEIAPPEDTDDRWGFQGSYGLDVEITGLYKSDVTGPDIQELSKYDALYEYVDAEIGDTVWVVILEYNQGDTFGSSGAWTIPAITDSLVEAERVVNRCHATSDISGFRPWDDYFASVNSIRIKRFKVH